MKIKRNTREILGGETRRPALRGPIWPVPKTQASVPEIVETAENAEVPVQPLAAAKKQNRTAKGTKRRKKTVRSRASASCCVLWKVDNLLVISLEINHEQQTGEIE